MAPKVVFVLGGPGAGKGTQCERIVNEFGFVHLSAGDLLREERAKPESKNGQLIETYIKEGKIVPVEITCKLLEEAMIATGKDKFLIDGFPRNQNNLEGWQKTMSDKAEICFVLFLDCPEEVCVNRCLKRGAGGSGRSDDNLESLKKRLVTYRDETKPIIDFYEAKNQVVKIDASQSAEQVFSEIEKEFSRFK